MEGHPFTWERSKGTDNWIEECLDRVLASQSWISLFQNVGVFNLEASSSDHSILFLDFLSVGQMRKRSFRFENSWLKGPECREVVIGS